MFDPRLFLPRWPALSKCSLKLSLALTLRYLISGVFRSFRKRFFSFFFPARANTAFLTQMFPALTILWLLFCRNYSQDIRKADNRNSSGAGSTSTPLYMNMWNLSAAFVSIFSIHFLIRLHHNIQNIVLFNITGDIKALGRGMG